jgi:hypothetical protein
MSTESALVRASLVLAVAVAGTGCGTAYADGTTAPTGSASARPAYVPLLDQPPPSAEKSPAPSKADWAAAPVAPEVRVTDPDCKATRLREWYRVECGDTHASLVGGTREGVEVGRSEELYRAWTVFPARRGDRRVVLLSRRSKWSIASDAIVSEQWLDGDPAPLITVIGIPE